MSTTRPDRARSDDARPDSGRHAWLAPLALCLGLVSLLIPVLGSPIAVAAIIAGALALRRGHGRPDWMAVTGVIAASIQIAISALLLLAT